MPSIKGSTRKSYGLKQLQHPRHQIKLNQSRPKLIQPQKTKTNSRKKKTKCYLSSPSLKMCCNSFHTKSMQEQAFSRMGSWWGLISTKSLWFCEDLEMEFMRRGRATGMEGWIWWIVKISSSKLVLKPILPLKSPNIFYFCKQTPCQNSAIDLGKFCPKFCFLSLRYN